MQLPDSWVDSLFARLQVRYGAAWTRMWEGLDIAAVKADWAAELGGFGSRPDAISYALDNLPPDYPPTCTAFGMICRRRPDPVVKELPAPVASKEAVERAVAKAVRGTDAPSGKAWAWRLRKREMECDRLTGAQRSMWREALKEELATKEAA